ncbi:hypothetical protein AB0I66_06680 [Streptomyces sp. NPDC050439]|uniref:hypothetical protein n=1 Tax=unclassified Streptomyces TaxID=2593676 RepID=UPI0034358C22
MQVHITIAEDAGAAPTAATGQQLAVPRNATGTAEAGPVTDGGEAPAWLTELVRLADAGQVARPGEEPQEARGSSDGRAMDAGSAR